MQTLTISYKFSAGNTPTIPTYTGQGELDINVGDFYDVDEVLEQAHKRAKRKVSASMAMPLSMVRIEDIWIGR